MNPKIDEIFSAIRILEESLKKELDLEEAKISADVLAAQTKFKIGLLRYLAHTPFLYLISAPIIYAGIIPALILELFLFLYQMINFRIYKIAPVHRKEYFNYDRSELKYLNIIEKINCFYCSYFSGLVGYTAEILGRTEQFWCSIRHVKKLRFQHPHYIKFLPYGDGERYRRELPNLRDSLKETSLEKQVQ